MKVFVCLAVFAFVAAAQAETPREKLRKYSDECKSVSGVSEELLTRVRNHEDVHDPKLDEHGFCILKKAGFMNEAGDIMTDTIKTKLKQNSEHPDTIDALVDKCNEKKDTPQHTASHLFTCLVDKKVHSH
ncbi:B1 protein-like [Tribolium madens]|uniref:B1 protein-like n=1 Tax=Tribolium madens TaxID=41895 RepID=UPI001CF737B9|nr:B1 protein-like [Tribolium madens]